MSTPFALAVAARLRERGIGFGRVHEHHAELASTNQRAMEWAGQRAPDGAVVSAERQLAGRGRAGRTWVSDVPGDLYVSVILRREAPRNTPAALSLVVGLSIRQALLDLREVETQAGGSAALRLKWPNDLLLNERKVGGILCESRSLGAQWNAILGFGLNLVQRADWGELAGSAASLHDWSSPHPLEPAEVLVRILGRLEADLEDFWSEGFAPFREAYQSASGLGKGRNTTLYLREREGVQRVAVEVVDIEQDGALKIRDASGERRLMAGELYLAPQGTV